MDVSEEGGESFVDGMDESAASRLSREGIRSLMSFCRAKECAAEASRFVRSWRLR